VRLLLLGVTCAALASFGCGSSSPAAPESSQQDDPAAAPTSVLLAGKTLTLSTYLWRDFHPISPSDGKALSGMLRISTADGSAVPSSISADRVWIILESQVWTVTPSEVGTRDGTAPVYELTFRDGPKWGPGVTVDVVIRLQEGSGRTVLLRVASQPIQRTD
jgi:hypothetical protein